MPKTICYLRVSSPQQDTEKNKADILKFANERTFGHVKFIEEKISGKKSWKKRKIFNIINDLGKNDRLIVPELSRLGRSMLEVIEIIAVAKEKNINVYSVKGPWELNGTITSKVMCMVFAMVAEIEHDFISARVKEGLRQAKLQGKQLGRPKGPGKSKLDKHREEIIALLKTGSTKAYVTKKFKTSQPNLYNWMKKNKIIVKPEY
jgi:DNA invertase Pin-like site-specific DNA recombinase